MHTELMLSSSFGSLLHVSNAATGAARQCPELHVCRNNCTTQIHTHTATTHLDQLVDLAGIPNRNVCIISAMDLHHEAAAAAAEVAAAAAVQVMPMSSTEKKSCRKGTPHLSCRSPPVPLLHPQPTPKTSTLPPAPLSHTQTVRGCCANLAQTHKHNSRSALQWPQGSVGMLLPHQLSACLQHPPASATM